MRGFFAARFSSAKWPLKRRAFANSATRTSLVRLTIDKHAKSIQKAACWRNFRCQAAVNQADGTAEAVAIRKAHFVHFGADGSEHQLPARIDNNRAFLDLGTKGVDAIGKYRCELTTASDAYVYGNQFIMSKQAITIAI